MSGTVLGEWVIGDGALGAPSSEPLTTWVPSTRNIAAFLRARTNTRVEDTYGISVDTEAADFTTKTRPKRESVAEIILQVSARVGAIVGNPCPTRVAALAQLTCTYAVCADIEASYFPRQSRDGETANDYFTKQADKLLDELRVVNAAIGAGDQPGSQDNTGLMAGSFPASVLSVQTPCGVFPRRI